MEKFEEVYEKMSNDYEALERLISSIYSKEGDSDLVMSLAGIAKKLLDTQIIFTDNYCIDDIKEIVINSLCIKKDALNNELNKERSR